MTFGGLIEHSIVLGPFEDAGGDESWLTWKAPTALEVKRAFAVTTATTAAGTVNYFSVALQNDGTAGSGTAALAAAAGGTAGWTADTPISMTLSEGTMASGEWLKVVYAKTGTVTPGDITVSVDYVLGTGA